eukprot:CAMPEP_0201912116 /NCGR_PEP_ID=MMETSP0903-20130614/2870_1 /ASSEMBLY_ACC=CAM_ASM_000552 /TAXON_ID=420261 /ORGANISM="Thalassiosira antarctica, Strain CCMP982" /LENGTH=1009 /DNA_ID=CAMNT_0048447001 /DNA_START=24 /DNA_END=3053 /DNA_ORIENTATION=-
MPALVIFRKFTTRPLAGDDMHIACLILGFYRAVQFICLCPLWIKFYLRRVKGEDIYVNELPPWCDQYEHYSFYIEDGQLPILKEEIGNADYKSGSFLDEFLFNSVAYFFYDVAWIIMVWNSASIGTPTEPMRRDVYIRNLIKFKMFVSNLYPLVLLGMGVYYVYAIRDNNYGCGADGEPVTRPDEGVWYGLYCALLITYALELLIWPAIITNKFIRILRTNIFWDRNRVEGRGGKVERFERKLGLILKMLSCIARGKAGGKDLKNKGELKEFASHIMCLLNNQTRLDLVLSDIYLGMRMLSNVQAERKVEAIKKMAKKNKLLQRQLNRDGNQHEFMGSQSPYDPSESEQTEIDLAPRPGRRPTMLVLQMQHNASYEVCEREVLEESNAADQIVMSDGAHFVKYASYIYVELPNCVIDEFMGGEEECSDFKRELDTLFFRDMFRLTSIGLEHAILCYANFVNGIVSTPYAIMIDEEMKCVVIAVRGTRSLEDLVVDVQFVPESLEKIGRVCGFRGEDRYCHKGFLARSKWMYNDIKKSKVLKTLHSDQSPFKDYPLVLCGHSLGAGCASILSLMLRPSFPSLQCFAYEPPGCIFDDELSEECSEFITSFVRHDDLVPRLSYHNFETLRDEFFNAFARIKVPKIELFFHLKVPYSERFVALRNAKVLRPKEDIPTGTIFNEQLELFRAERAEKNSRGVNRVQLFIPGKIVHLVDISGDGNYVPYWARRGEFNQLEISKRMYADHDIHSLVGILRDTRLGGANTISLAFHNAPLIYVDDEDDSENDVRLFAFCSNPYGKLPIILWVLGLIATSLSTNASIGCDFVRVSFDAANVNGTLSLAYGIFTYELLDCDTSTGPCDKIQDYMDNTECVPYPPKLEHGGYGQTGLIFHGLAGIFGWFALSMLLISMCFIFKQRTWGIITVLLLGVTLFEGLVLIIGREFSVWCSEPDAVCSIGADAIKVIVACCIWFLMAIGSGYLAMVGKRSETRIENIGEGNELEESPQTDQKNQSS